MRLQKFMARCGVASRRKSEEIIEEGRVKINGDIITQPGTKVDPDKDIIEVDNKKIKLEENNVYILLNKPVGYITTVDDEFGRKKVLDLLSDIKERIYPVGRLDYDTSGFLLLTNDGDLAYKLTHPKYEVKKKYIADVEGIPTKNELEQFRSGLEIEDYVTSKAQVKIINSSKGASTLEIVIHEGRNRQVRKMCAKIGHPVVNLKRIELDKIKLGNLKEGKWRHLTNKELESLKR